MGDVVWSTARLAYHLASYERKIGLPSMRQWLGDPLPDSLGMEEDAAAEGWAWQREQAIDVASLLADLTVIRASRSPCCHTSARRIGMSGATPSGER